MQFPDIFAELLSVETSTSTIPIDPLGLIDVPGDEFFKEISILPKKIIRWPQTPDIIPDQLTLVTQLHQLLQANYAKVLSSPVIDKQGLE